MSQPAGPAAAPYGDVPWPGPGTIVLRGRPLHPLADTTTLSRFRDDVWVTRAADVDNAVLAPALSFTPCPPALRDTAKAFALAVLDHERPASLMTGSPGEQASLSSLGGWLCELRVLAEWPGARHVHRVCDVTADDLDLFRAHVTALSASRARQAGYLHVIRVLWAYREHLPPECRLPAHGPGDRRQHGSSPGTPGTAVTTRPPGSTRTQWMRCWPGRSASLRTSGQTSAPRSSKTASSRTAPTPRPGSTGSTTSPGRSWHASGTTCRSCATPGCRCPASETRTARSRWPAGTSPGCSPWMAPIPHTTSLTRSSPPLRSTASRSARTHRPARSRAASTGCPGGASPSG